MAANEGVSRRKFAQLATAAVGGVLAGSTAALADSHKEGEKKEGKKIFVDPAILLEGPNVCKGLNACKGEGKGDHECGGKGECATAAAHSCGGHNECKGQGGCGGYPGQNTCKEKGHCAVPLKKQTWEIARKQFDHLMKDMKKAEGS
jgi:hypothetical protein